MIVKSYEVQKNASNFLKYNFYLLYGENLGLKKDIRDIIKTAVKQKNDSIEMLSLYETEIINNEKIFFNFIYSGSLFGNKKIITIYETTDKIIKKISDIYDKYPDNVFLIIFSEILEKKSKLRNFFETNKKTICIPCYLDSTKDLEVIAQLEFRKNNIVLSREATRLLIEKSNALGGILKPNKSNIYQLDQGFWMPNYTGIKEMDNFLDKIFIKKKFNKFWYKKNQIQ